MAHASRTVPAQIARDRAATQGEADERELTTVELRDQLLQSLGERVGVIADARPVGAAEAATVIGDDPVTRSEKRRDLFLL